MTLFYIPMKKSPPKRCISVLPPLLIPYSFIPLFVSSSSAPCFFPGKQGGGKERRNPRRRQTDSKTAAAAAAAAAAQAAFLVSRQGKNSLFRISLTWTEGGGNREFPANLWEKSVNVGFFFPSSSSRVRPERARKREEVDRG